MSLANHEVSGGFHKRRHAAPSLAAVGASVRRRVTGQPFQSIAAGRMLAAT